MQGVMPRMAVAAACLGLLVLVPPAQAASDAVPGELLVRFEEGIAGSERADARADSDVSLKRQTRISGLQLVKAEPGQTVGQAIGELEADSRVAYAEPNSIVRPAATTNDPFLNTLWGLDKIAAPGAWDVTRGSSSVLVAVTDTGVAYDHPDLAGRMWTNAAETPGNGTDDDNNGYVDDVRGWDAIDGDNDPRDLEEHGTHVAGTIGAEGNNATGITGVAQDSRIMPIRVLRPGGGTASALAEGFDYAGDMGADVVNASLSGEGRVRSVQDVVDAHPDTLYVAAAGNDSVDVDNGASTRWPCNFTSANLICVAATDQSDNRASFSNVGATSVDLGAPGVGVRSTVSASEELAGTRDDFEASDFLTRWTPAGGWARTDERAAGGSWSMTDSPGANYAANTDSEVRTATPYDLTGKQGCFLHYDLRLRTETNFDKLRVETSQDGVNWASRREFSGVPAAGAFAPYSTYLFSDGAQPYVRFRLTTDGQGTNDDGAHVDNVRVLCKSSTYSDSNYKYFSGTSMAAPHVSGTAALVLSLRPSSTVAQLRAALLETGDPVAGLSGGTVTGRRLNAVGAVGHAGPLAVTEAASQVGGRGATLNGTVNPVGSATTYRFEYGPTTAYGSQTTPKSAGAGTTRGAATDSITGLVPGTEYHFRLVASRGATEALGADQTFTTTGTPSPPGQVEGLGAQPGVQAASLDWDNTPTATGYEIFKREQAGGSYPDTPTDTTTVSEKTLTGLTAGVAVCFRVRAVNSDGPGPGSDEVCTTPTGPLPATPGGLTATGGVRSVSLNWGDAQYATGYLVHRRLSTGAYPAFPLAGRGTSDFGDSGLSAGTSYCYRVQGTNSYGNGPTSMERCAVAKAPAAVPAAPKPSYPAPALQSAPSEPALADLSRTRRSVTATRRGVLVWSFRATPGVTGRVTFTIKVGRRTVRLGSKRFRAGSSRSVRPRVRLSRRHMKLLRARKRLRVRATVALAGKKSSRTFTLKPPRGRR